MFRTCGRLLSAVPLTMGLLLSAACTTDPTTGENRTYSYNCDDEPDRVVVFVDGERGHLFAREVSQPMQLRSDTEQFVGADVIYKPMSTPDSANGQTAEITILGRALSNCRNDSRAAVWESAKLRGISYRAIGQEPPWILEIDREHGFLLITEYGSRQHRLPYVQPVTDPKTRTTRYSILAEEQTITITIVGQSCQDSMSGEAFSSRVHIDWQERPLQGCGRPLH